MRASGPVFIFHSGGTSPKVFRAGDDEQRLERVPGNHASAGGQYVGNCVARELVSKLDLELQQMLVCLQEVLSEPGNALMRQGVASAGPLLSFLRQRPRTESRHLGKDIEERFPAFRYVNAHSFLTRRERRIEFGRDAWYL